MGKLMRALERVGLVEMSERAPEAEQTVLAQSGEAMPVAESAPIEAPLPAATLPGGLVEQRAFEDIYAEQSVQATPFTADKLLRVLDGLGALDPVSRKAAVQALDAADDAWSIDDVLLDAERKRRALEVNKRQLEQHARAALQSAREEIEARDQRQQEAVSRIRQQITDLEALLEREVTRATEEKAKLDADARATKDACIRETTRLDAEAARLGRIAAIFGSPAPPGPVSA